MARSHDSINRLQGQQGSTIIWFALFLPVLLGFTALAVDLARINLTRSELQNAADAAALAGARSLTPPGSAASDKPYNWSGATAMALSVAQRNYANGSMIKSTQVTVEPTPFYWHLPSGDVPAIRVTVAIPGLKLFFAPILGIAESSVKASSTSVVTTPSGGLGLFPFVIDKRMLDHYWNTSAGSPVRIRGEAPTIKLGYKYELDDEEVLSGQWTTFQSSTKDPDVDFMRTLMQNGNTKKLSIGDKTYIQPGAKATLYREVPVGKDVAMFVVNDTDDNSFQRIVAIAAFHIDGYSQGGKYITGHFIDVAIIPGLDAGNGNGVDYGAYTPPLLVQ